MSFHRSLFCRLLLLLRHGVKPVLVLEGKAPPQKGAEIQRRHYQQQRRKSRENKCKSFSSADRKSANATTSTSQTRADVSDINEVKIRSIQSSLNPCPAELFQIIFHSFEAGIANAISSFK